MERQGDNRLAKLFKDRNNPTPNGNIIGKIVSVSPITISIMDGNALLDIDDLYFISKFWDTTKNTHNFTNIDLNKDVLLLPTPSSQQYFLIDYVYGGTA